MAWAHLLQTASSGAFTNPYEMRETLDDAVWWGKKRAQDLTGKKAEEIAAATPAAKIAAGKALAEKLKAMRERSRQAAEQASDLPEP